MVMGIDGDGVKVRVRVRRGVDGVMGWGRVMKGFCEGLTVFLEELFVTFSSVFEIFRGIDCSIRYSFLAMTIIYLSIFIESFTYSST